MDLSIIVPIYNVEQYVRACIESIYQQGLDEDRFEVILVNDGTKDKSMEMIADIIQQHKNITVINQENQGLSMARNNGIAMAKGEYILMPDSDDLLIENSVEPLLEKPWRQKPTWLWQILWRWMTKKQNKGNSGHYNQQPLISQQSEAKIFTLTVSIPPNVMYGTHYTGLHSYAITI